MKLLYVYLIDDVVYNIYLLVTVLLPCLIYQGVMKIKAKSNMKKMPAKYYVGVYAFLVYLWAVFKVTGIGLLADIIRPGIRGGVNLRPFADLGVGFWLNIVMFLPLGIVTPCIWKKCGSVRYTVRLGFAVSLLIECSQIFNGRATDIDDLIANTAGFLVGYLTAQGFLELFDKKTYKYGIIRILSTVILFCISIFALSFWANGDALQAGKVENCAKKCDKRKDQAVSISLLE